MPLKLFLMLFWALWFSLVLLTNTIEGLNILGIFPAWKPLASDNYELIEKATSRYHLPNWFNKLLFLGVILWQVLTAGLFWWLLVNSWRTDSVMESLLQAAFLSGLSLFGAFMLSDEVFHTYQGERSHLEIFTGLLVTFLLIKFL